MAKNVKERFGNIEKIDKEEDREEKEVLRAKGYEEPRTACVSDDLHSIVMRQGSAVVPPCEESLRKFSKELNRNLQSNCHSEAGSCDRNEPIPLSINHLPRFYLKESSTQTLLTSNDIDNLIHSNQISNSNCEMLGLNLMSQGNKKDWCMLKKIFPNDLEKRFKEFLKYSAKFKSIEEGVSSQNGNLMSEHNSFPFIKEKRERCLINIKRKPDKDVLNLSLQLSSSKADQGSNVKSKKGKQQNERDNQNPHIHMKKNGKKPNKKDLQLKEEDNSDHSSKKLKHVSTSNLSRNQSYMVESSLFNTSKNKIMAECFDNNVSVEKISSDMRDEDVDISDIIKGIKNSSTAAKREEKKEVKSSPSFKTLAQVIQNSPKKQLAKETQINEFSFRNLKMENKVEPTTMNKPPVKRFDAYQFFKLEYQTSHANKSEEELERDCKKEWNTLDKELKKVYNIMAERERKNHKTQKKNLKEIEQNK